MRVDSVVNNVFAVITIIILILNLAYFAGTHNKHGFLMLWLYGIGMALIDALNFIAGLDFVSTSISVSASIVIIAFPLSAIVFQICALCKVKNKPVGKAFRFAEILTTILMSVLLIILVIFSYDATQNSGYSKFVYSTGRAEFLLWFTIIVILAMSYRVFITDSGFGFKAGIRKNWVTLMIIAVLGGYGLFNFLGAQFSVNSDIKSANQEFTQAFGDEALATSQNMRKIPYSVSAVWLNMRTDNYALTKDVEYYKKDGLTLRYDVYEPTYSNAHRSVLVALHGSGNDKGNLSIPHRNKYFASQGYVVYDLQIGDWNEKNTGIGPKGERNVKDLSGHLNDFLTFASTEHRQQANWDSVFLTGYSMGGGVILDYLFAGSEAVATPNITVKGIIPYYPGLYDDITITENAVPCLILAGKNDFIFYNARTVAELYEKANNDKCALITLSKAGHGCDSYMSSRGNQIFTYYMERFMALYR